jgi:hypothetical protein
MEYQENHLNKLYEMVRKPNPTTYTLLAGTSPRYLELVDTCIAFPRLFRVHAISSIQK